MSEESKSTPSDQESEAKKPASETDGEPEASSKPTEGADEDAGTPAAEPASIEELEPLPSEEEAPPSRPPPGPPPSKPPPRADRPAAAGGRELPTPGYKSAVPPAAKDHPSTIPPRKFPPEVVADIMTRQIIALGEQERVANIESGMKRFRFRHLPVVSADNKLVGLISHRDLLRVFAEGVPQAEGEAEPVTDETEAGSVMRREVLTTRADTSLVSAGQAMLAKKIGCLPVIEEDNTLIGILTDTDFLKLAIELLDRQRPAKRADRDH